MLTNKRIIAFAIYALCLLGIPGKMIIDQNKIFSEGNAYKFKCQPLDPNDPFRGKYVRLGFERIEVPKVTNEYKNKNYGVIEVDNDGFASIRKVIQDPTSTDSFVEIDFRFSNDTLSRFTLPFDRLYMNENKAYAAEELYRNALNDSTQNVYAKVYIYKGRYLLEDVYVNDTRLRDAVE